MDDGVIGWLVIGGFALFFGTVFYSVLTTPIPVPADPPINEECYELKSEFMIIVDYLDGCEEEIEKMYNYGYTEIAYNSDHVNGEQLLMFRK